MSELRYVYQYEVVAVILSLISAGVMLYRRNLKRRKNKLFFVILIMMAVSGIFDVMADILINTITKETAAGVPVTVDMNLLSFVQGAFLFVHNSTPFMWFAYVNTMISKSKNRKRFFALASIPCVIELLLIVTNPFTRWVYYFEDYSYTHGLGIYVLYLIAGAYLFVSLIQTIKYWSILPKGHAAFVVTFTALTVFGITFQLLVSNMLIELFVESICLLFMTFTLETEIQTRNPVTKLYNRPSFVYEVQKNLFHHDKRELVLLKLADMGHMNSVLGVNPVSMAVADVGVFFITLDKNRCYDCDNGNLALIFDDTIERDKLMERIKERFEHPFGDENNHIHFYPSYIYLSIPQDISSIEEIDLLINDTYVKEGQYDKEVLVGLKRRVEVEEAIQRALDNETLQVYYQPIYSRADNRINSAEALARIFDDKLGFISPLEFIPAAEKSGKIGPLGELVFKKTLQFYSDHKNELKNLEYIEVNLSVAQLNDPDFYDTFSSIAGIYDVPTSFINFEITESAFIDNQDYVLSVIDKFCKDGFSFSLDDFGTGYSNFSYLYDMNFKIVKLDKSILDKSAVNENADKTLHSMIGMLKDIRYKVLQEGVETKEQEDKLFDYGIDYIQGFYHSKPLPETEFLEFFKQNN